MNILDKIVAYKKEEVKAFHKDHYIGQLKEEVMPSPLSFYDTIDAKAQQGDYFIITEFKRKSPSEGWINQELSVEEQVNTYRTKGTSAISVLTDTVSFGGGYEDLKVATTALQGSGILVLQKDFVIDPIQIYLARRFGANMILLIAAILDADDMAELKAIAESLNMGVLAEVHSLEEYEKIVHLDFPVIGINNRNLNNFKTSINCCNYIAQRIGHRGHIIAESGISGALDLRITQQHAQGFLIGTSLMRNSKQLNFKSLTEKRYFFKACGIRTAALLKQDTADLIGVNFSGISKRKVDETWMSLDMVPGNAVAVFKENTEDEINEVIQKYGFRYVQLYADDFGVKYVKSIRQKVILAISVKDERDLALAEEYAPYIDLFILDGAKPGSGEQIESTIPKDFPYPFLLAGGMNASNLTRILNYDHCIGVDMASGIESDGEVDAAKIEEVREKLANL
ncbi:MAG: hypothetical protein ACPGJS_06995 [Flammeovirgaceae bacterium]